jgi:ubiquitin C-terminal hydrolase
MKHLTGYDQKDAHEFLHSFLDNTGKSMRQFRDSVWRSKNTPNSVGDNVIDNKKPEQGMYLSRCDLGCSDSADTHSVCTHSDIIKSIFEGTLRSVLMCQECGNKRIQSEPFVSLSLPLSIEVKLATNGFPGESSNTSGPGAGPGDRGLSLERCLRHFTLPEKLVDPVDCPECGKKTATQKQHVVSKLPPILCLHLKRFDAKANRKIEDFVSFPARGLNMGPHLPHW